MGFSSYSTNHIDWEHRLIRHACRNGAQVDVRSAVLRLPEDFSLETVESTTDSNVVGFDNRVPKLFHLTTNFGTIAYLILTYSN